MNPLTQFFAPWKQRRRAAPGELCLCGHQAEIVIDSPAFGPAFGSCLAKHDHPEHGPCPFCKAHLRHSTGADCPNYQLQPETHTGVTAR